MAYVGVSGQFDGGLTNPSRQPGGRFSYLGFGQQKPAGTKPLATGPAAGGGVGAAGVSGTTLPTQSTDEYWPWEMPRPGGLWTNPTAGKADARKAGDPEFKYGPNARPWAYVNYAGDRQGPADEGPKVADYVSAPGMPGYTPGGGDAASAAAGAYQSYDPTLWNEPDIGIPEAGVNTREIVNALKPQLEEEMAAGMGNAARRFGALGQLQGTGYADTLGNVERKMFSDLNALNYKYDYDAAQADANRKSTAREGTLGRAYGAWGQTEGMRAGEANRRTGYNVGQQDREDEMSRFNASRADTEADRKGAFDWKKYSAGLSEAERQQMYDQLKLQFGG